MRTLIAIMMVALLASSSAFARKASHHHFKRAAPKHQSADRGGVQRDPADVELERSEAFAMAAELLSARIAFKHRRQRDVQGFANVEQSRRTHAVYALFIFLNLLKRDAQFLAKVSLADVECVPALAHPSADISVDRICASRGS